MSLANDVLRFFVGCELARNVARKRATYIFVATCWQASLGAAPQSAAASARADAIVAADGSGQYTSVQEAISAAPMRTGATDPRWVIFVKAGTYRERIYVQRERGNIAVLGEDAEKTIITYDLHAGLPGEDGKPIGTFRTPTVQIDADGMVWENLTLANAAGEPGPRPGAPTVAQALALRVDGDRVVFRHCRFLGWQDTILVNRGRQYFADCYVEGSVDFIFGAATAYFDRCHIHCLKDGYITAASTPEGQPHGLVFADCTITGRDGVKSYLGRPWRNFARTVFIRTAMSAVVRPAGWHNWNKPEAEKTAFYAEYESSGPGSNPPGRVAWAKKTETGEVDRFTPAAVLAGLDGWDPAPGPVIHFAGDSTMADKPDLDYPERGWGQLFRELVRPPWRLVNYAANGRSTKSFRALGHWDRLLARLQPEDWVVIQFGHNDGKQSDPLRYTDPLADYPANLRRFVQEVREHGAHPVLATSVVRCEWDQAGRLKDTHGAYLAAVREVAAAESVPLLDLETVTRRLETELGPGLSRKLHLIFAPGENPRLPEGKTDNTHYVAAGARLVAELAAREMQRLGLPFAASLAVPAPGAVKLTDLEYGRAAGEGLKLDVSVPEGAGPFPVAILVHGGGWSRGDKFRVPSGDSADITPWFAPLTVAKFTWFSINYRLAPAHPWPACLEDVQTAIRWVKAHAAEFKGDPARIALFGHSAGGHLVCLAATLAGDDTRVQAVVGFAPVTDFEFELPARGGLSPSLQMLHGQPKEVTPASLALLRETAPINHVRPGLPPFLLLHGDADQTVPYQTSVNFQARLRANGVPCELITIPGASHHLNTWERRAPDYPARLVAWLRQTLK